MKKQKKIALILGVTGQDGSFMAKLLLKKNYIVHGLIRKSATGNLKNVSKIIKNNKLFKIHHGDLLDFVSITNIVSKIKPDEIYNLACPASPVHYQYDPVQTTKTSVHGSINMLGLAKRTKAKILLSSTSEVYGDPAVHPQTEDYWGNVNPVGPRSCYDEGKRCAETLFFDYFREHRLRIKVARIFNTYGPRMSIDDGRVVTNLVFQALKNYRLYMTDEQEVLSEKILDDL